jgi:hypothetical protein
MFGHLSAVRRFRGLSRDSRDSDNDRMMLAPPAISHTARTFGFAFALTCAAIAGAQQAFAWGRIAHTPIAWVAERHLTPDAAKEVRRLLSLEEASSLGEVASWADRDWRENRPGPDHDVPIPLEADGYDAARDCQGRCAVGAIEIYLGVLADRTKPDQDRLDALKYVVHLVGDIHQPLHASQAGGWETVSWRGVTSNLHLLWDVRILQATYTSPEQVAEEISKRLRPMPDCGTPADWANEGHKIVKTFVYPELGPPPAIKIQSIAIPDDYVAKALPIIQERLAEAAMRLSCVLNKALDPPK